MKTVFLIKTEPQNNTFDCDVRSGLTFTTTYLDVRYLNNVVINGDIRIFVRQEVINGPGKPVMWFLIETKEALHNESFEHAWKYIVEVGSMLQKFTQMGLSFKYQNAWSFPNVPETWVFEELLVEFTKGGRFKGIYWNDPSEPIYEENGRPLRKSTIKEVKADFVTVFNAEQLLPQSHFTHITVPGTNIKVDASGFDQDNSVLQKISTEGISASDPNHLYLQVLYNKAISTNDIFLSFTVLYQMIEVLISISQVKRLEKSQKDAILAFVKEQPSVAPLVHRISGALDNITLQTSFELFQAGIRMMVGADYEVNITNKQLSTWRRFRGKFTHPKEINSITEKSFVHKYNELRKFCDEFMSRLNNRPSGSLSK